MLVQHCCKLHGQMQGRMCGRVSCKAVLRFGSVVCGKEFACFAGTSGHGHAAHTLLSHHLTCYFVQRIRLLQTCRLACIHGPRGKLPLRWLNRL